MHGNSQTPGRTLQQKASSHWSPQLALPLLYPVVVFRKLAGLPGREKQKDAVKTGRKIVKALVHGGGQGTVGGRLGKGHQEESPKSPKV